MSVPQGTEVGDARFRVGLEAMLDSVVITTAVRAGDGRIVDFVVDYINPVAEVGQRTAAQIVGRRFLDVWPATKDSPIWTMYLQLMETGEPVVLDNYVYSEMIDGHPVTAIVDVRTTRLGDGFLQNFRDATGRFRMQEDLAASERRFRSAVDALLDPFFMLSPVRDDEGEVVELEYRYVNRAALKLLGIPESAVVGHGQLELFPSVRELGIWDNYLLALQTGAATRVDVPYFDENGVAGSFELAVTPGDEGLIIAARDVSEARMAQEALRVLNSKLEERVTQRTSELVRAEADRWALETELREGERLQTVGQLTSGIAHEFRNLLGIIIGYAEMAEDVSEDLDPDLRRVLSEIRAAAERAVHLTSDLLRFSRRARTRPEAIDLDTLVSDMKDLLTVCMSGTAEVVLNPSPTSLPLVLAERSQLEQVLLNLAVNARDAMPGGGTLTISTRSAHRSAQTPHPLAGTSHTAYVELDVKDTGTGMSSDVKARIFERFFTTKSAEAGTGLGLSTVAGIVDDAGGSIEVDTREGHGTAFRIYLPAVSPADCEPRAAPGRRAR
jgi:signal transduction histidine kinase